MELVLALFLLILVWGLAIVGQQQDALNAKLHAMLDDTNEKIKH